MIGEWEKNKRPTASSGWRPVHFFYKVYVGASVRAKRERARQTLNSRHPLARMNV